CREPVHYKFHRTSIGCWRFELIGPEPEALALVADGRISYIELSLDWIFVTELEARKASRWVHRNSIVSHHRADHTVSSACGSTHYAAPPLFRKGPARKRDRLTRKRWVAYGDRECRITGELGCCHNDFRLRSAAVILNAGIHGPADLLPYD